MPSFWTTWATVFPPANSASASRRSQTIFSGSVCFPIASLLPVRGQRLSYLLAQVSGSRSTPLRLLESSENRCQRLDERHGKGVLRPDFHDLGTMPPRPARS